MSLSGYYSGVALKDFEKIFPSVELDTSKSLKKTIQEQQKQIEELKNVILDLELELRKIKFGYK